MNIAKGYAGCTRKDFESMSKEQLVDILVNITELKLERTDDWYPQEYFIPRDELVDVLRIRFIGEEHFDRRMAEN
jgi:hypothetical protein